MKTNNDTRRNRLDKLLRSAYAGKMKIPVASQWQQQTMLRIRLLEDLVGPSYALLMERMLWRMAPAVLVLTMVAGTVLASIGIMPEYDLYQAFVFGISPWDLLEIFSI